MVEYESRRHERLEKAKDKSLKGERRDEEGYTVMNDLLFGDVKLVFSILEVTEKLL